MTSRDFCFWLQGFFEIANPSELYELEIEMIKKHFNMVFIHEIDPSMPNKKLDSIYNGDTPYSDLLMRC